MGFSPTGTSVPNVLRAAKCVQQLSAQPATTVTFRMGKNVLSVTSSVKHAVPKTSAQSAQISLSLCLTAKQATIFKIVCRNVIMDITRRMGKSVVLAVRIAHSAQQISAQSAKKVLFWRATNVLRVTASVKHAVPKMSALSAQVTTSLCTIARQAISFKIVCRVVALGITRRIRKSVVLAVLIALSAIQSTSARSAKTVIFWRATNVLSVTASVKHAVPKIPASFAQMASSLCMTAKPAKLLKIVCRVVALGITRRMGKSVTLAV